MLQNIQLGGCAGDNAVELRNLLLLLAELRDEGFSVFLRFGNFLSGAGVFRAARFRYSLNFGKPRFERVTFGAHLRERVGDFGVAGFRGAKLDFDVGYRRAVARDFAFAHQKFLAFLRECAVCGGKVGEQFFELALAFAVNFVRAFDVADVLFLVRRVALQARIQLGAAGGERNAFLLNLCDAFPQVVLADFRHLNLRFRVFFFGAQSKRHLRTLFNALEKLGAGNFGFGEFFFAFP